MEIVVQMNHANCLESEFSWRAVVRLNNEALASDIELMSAERTTLFSERFSFTLEVKVVLPQRIAETWKIESPNCATEEVEGDFKFTEKLADLNL